MGLIRSDNYIYVGDSVCVYMTEDWWFKGIVTDIPNAPMEAWKIRHGDSPNDIAYVQQYMAMTRIDALPIRWLEDTPK